MAGPSLIVNADDFGASSKINNATILLHNKGVVSSTTIISKGRAFEEGLIMLKENPKLGVGVHLCLDGNFNVGNDYLTLIDSNTNHFHNLTSLIYKLRKFSLNSSEIFKEYSLQVERTLDNGIRISHLDHHHNLHSYPQILNCMIRVAKKYKIKYIRSLKNNNKNGIIKKYQKIIHQFYLKSRLNSIDGTYMIPNSGFDHQLNSLLDLLKIEGRIIEIMVHPADNNYSEMIFFSNTIVLNLLKDINIINYHDL